MNTLMMREEERKRKILAEKMNGFYSKRGRRRKELREQEPLMECLIPSAKVTNYSNMRTQAAAATTTTATATSVAAAAAAAAAAATTTTTKI